MKNFTFKSIRFFLIAAVVGALFSVGGCATTGDKFASLTPNQSTKEEVRDLLGEPEEVRSQDENNIWKYTFSKISGATPGSREQKALETEFIFEKDIMTDYRVSVVTKTIPEIDASGPAYRSQPEPQMKKSGPGPGPGPGQFLERFDTNRDGRVTRKEFRGPPEVFNRMDSNHDNIVGPEDFGR